MNLITLFLNNLVVAKYYNPRKNSLWNEMSLMPFKNSLFCDGGKLLLQSPFLFLFSISSIFLLHCRYRKGRI